MFQRANGNPLVTAFFDPAPLPFDPAVVAPEPGEIDRLQAINCRGVSQGKDHRPTSLLRPVTQGGLPLMGKVPAVVGTYVAPCVAYPQRPQGKPLATDP